MIPKKDQYADKEGKLTNDPLKYAAQIAVAGVFLDERIASRYGIIDSLASVDEPGAVRMVKGSIIGLESEESEPAAKAAASPKKDKPKSGVIKVAAKPGAKKEKMKVKIDTAAFWGEGRERERHEAGSVIEVSAEVYEMNSFWMKPTDDELKKIATPKDPKAKE